MSDYNFIDNDPAVVQSTILSSMETSIGAPLYPGDERRMFADAETALHVTMGNKFNDQAKQRFLRYARGVVLDYIGELQNVYRLQPSPAYAVFRFTVSEPQSTNIVIPKGTRITPDGIIYFATDENASLQAGESFVDVEATCQTAGSEYNGLAVGSVKTLVDLIPYIQEVSNITATSGGDDGEPYTTEGDDRFRNRIRLAPATRTTAGPESSYEYYALSADPDIVDVEIDCPKEQPTVVNIYVLMKGGELPDDETLQKVTDACRPKDRRPMTDKVTAMKPTQVPYDINVKYYVKAEDEAEVIANLEGEGGAIDQYIEWQQSELGRAINDDELRKYMFSPGEDKVGAYRIEITAPTYTELTDSQVAHFSGSLTVSHEVI